MNSSEFIIKKARENSLLEKVREVKDIYKQRKAKSLWGNCRQIL
ncbi:MAG: hypothetical protein U9Q06_03865 [Nanoarchaeota archaeon]|nr:hypothetical protein [Nanoarchaeota archaeon]